MQVTAKATALPVAPSVPPSISLSLLGADTGVSGAQLHSHTPEGSCEPGVPTSCQQRTALSTWNVRDSAGGFSGG